MGHDHLQRGLGSQPWGHLFTHLGKGPSEEAEALLRHCGLLACFSALAQAQVRRAFPRVLKPS